MPSNVSPEYERKFAQFIRLVANAQADDIGHVIIDQPSALGDTYAEVIESLSRLAEAGLALNITRR